MTKRRRLFAIGAAFALTIAACGSGEQSPGMTADPGFGSDDGEEASNNTSDSSTTVADGTPSPGSGSDSPSRAVLTIGEQNYAFDMTGVSGQCRDTGTSIHGSFTLDTDGAPLPSDQAGGVQAVTFDIPSPDSDDLDIIPARVLLVDNEAGLLWLAGADANEGVDPEHTVVESWTLSDGVAEGTAIFAELNSYPTDARGVPGTFKITCAD